MGLKAPIAIRVNPDVDAHTHEKISTGKSEHKFGIPLHSAGEAYEAASKYPNLILKGIQMHIGSQITEVGPIKNAIQKIAPFAIELKQKYGITHFSIGGGLGIVYPEALQSGEQAWWDSQPQNSQPLTPETYGATIVPLLQPLGLKIILEPGRYLVGNAGVLISRVEYVKKGFNKNFLILDAGMNDLVRPAMYDAHHQVVPLQLDQSRPKVTLDVVGPVCETSDCFAKDRSIQEVKEGEFVAIMSAGAYGKTMASRYNSRGLAAEVLVRD